MVKVKTLRPTELKFTSPYDENVIYTQRPSDGKAGAIVKFRTSLDSSPPHGTACSNGSESIKNQYFRTIFFLKNIAVS